MKPGETYVDDSELPKLWALASEHLNLSPAQHQEPVFKAILGNCQSIVNYLGAIRNKIGDAHGQGRKPVKPKPRHAELAVNLAGTMAAFLVFYLERTADEAIALLIRQQRALRPPPRLAIAVVHESRPSVHKDTSKQKLR